MIRVAGILAVGAVLLAGNAVAQTVDPSGQSANDKKEIEMLFQAQDRSGPALTREQIATYRDEAGWGKAFKQMQADGFYQGYKNFGQVISGSKTARSSIDVEKTPTSAETGFGFDGDKPAKAKTLQRISRINRPNRPKRPKRR